MKVYAEHYVNGRFTPSSSTTTIPVFNPSTEQPTAQVVACSPNDIELAIQSATNALSGWSHSTLEERGAALQRLATALEQRKEQFAQVLATEIGCPLWLGKGMQMSMPLDNLAHTITALPEVQWQEKIGNALVERLPIGVIGAITPWNFPIHQIVAKVAGAVAAGCTIVLKPSEVAAGAAQLFMEAVHEAGLPAGVVNLIWGGRAAGQALFTHPAINQISFTGSTNAGRQIMATAAQSLKRVMLELGGKSAAILLPDADIGKALTHVVRSSMVNSGQTCVNQSRLIVPSQHAESIQAQVLELMQDWQVGDPFLPDTRLGPVATAAQLDSIQRQLELAHKQGAQVNQVGNVRDMPTGWYCSPTLVSHAQPHMDIIQEETFGPVLSLLTYDDISEALQLANDSAYGLSGAVWSQDHDQAVQFAQGMRTGQVVINGAAQNLATPFGGWGDSGFGRENGRFGIEECLNYRSVQGVF